MLFWLYVAIFAAGFASGWAFYKHRDRIKMKAQIEEAEFKTKFRNAEDKAIDAVRPTRTPR